MAVIGAGRVARMGDGRRGRAWYFDGKDAITPGPQIPMRYGFDSVNAMLAKPGFTWAHRGGSQNYPEMSLYGYTQCVARGYGVLEVSLGRTIDGVWFGIHDATLARTSQVASTPDIRTMTWAQISAYQNTLNSNGTPRPYMRWEEVIEAYGHTHILVNDIKSGLYNATARTEYFAMMDRTGGPEKHIVKWGGGDTLIAPYATQRGYESWGYFYQNEMATPGTLQKMDAWSIIGMEWNAPKATWDVIKGLGKPIVAHICATQAAYDTAVANITADGYTGPYGVQCSNVLNIAPVSAWT